MAKRCIKHNWEYCTEIRETGGKEYGYIYQGGRVCSYEPKEKYYDNFRNGETGLLAVLESINVYSRQLQKRHEKRKRQTNKVGDKT